MKHYNTNESSYISDVFTCLPTFLQHLEAYAFSLSRSRDFYRVLVSYIVKDGYILIPKTHVGIDSFLPLFFESKDTLIDYVKSKNNGYYVIKTSSVKEIDT